MYHNLEPGQKQRNWYMVLPADFSCNLAASQYLPSITDRGHHTSLVLSIPYDGVWAFRAVGRTWLTLDLCRSGISLLGRGLEPGLFFSLGNVLIDAAANICQQRLDHRGNSLLPIVNLIDAPFDILVSADRVGECVQA
jgi:hypothetical protein